MSSALQAYALCVVVLFLKMFLVSCYQGYHRLRFVAFWGFSPVAKFRHGLPGFRRKSFAPRLT